MSLFFNFGCPQLQFICNEHVNKLQPHDSQSSARHCLFKFVFTRKCMYLKHYQISSGSYIKNQHWCRYLPWIPFPLYFALICSGNDHRMYVKLPSVMFISLGYIVLEFSKLSSLSSLNISPIVRVRSFTTYFWDYWYCNMRKFWRMWISCAEKGFGSCFLPKNFPLLLANFYCN